MNKQRLHTFTILKKKRENSLDILQVHMSEVKTYGTNLELKIEDLEEEIRLYNSELQRCNMFELSANTRKYLTTLYGKADNLVLEKQHVDSLAENIRNQIKEEMVEKRKASALMEKLANNLARERERINSKMMDELWLASVGVRTKW